MKIVDNKCGFVFLPDIVNMSQLELVFKLIYWYFKSWNRLLRINLIVSSLFFCLSQIVIQRIYFLFESSLLMS